MRFLRLLKTYDIIAEIHPKVYQATIKTNELTSLNRFCLALKYQELDEIGEALKTHIKDSPCAWEEKYGEKFRSFAELYFTYSNMKCDNNVLAYALEFIPAKIIHLSAELELGKILHNGPHSLETLANTFKISLTSMEYFLNILVNYEIIENTKKHFYNETAYSQCFNRILVPAGADVYVICRTLLNWWDDDAIKILNKVHESMNKNSKLFLIDFIVPPQLHHQHKRATFNDISLFTIY